MKLKLLLPLLGTAAMMVAGCSNPKEDPTPQTPPEPKPLTINITQGKETASTYTFKTEVSDQTQGYLCLYTDEKVALDKPNEDLIQFLMDDLKKQAEAKEQDFERYIASITLLGNQQPTITGLTPGTAYCLVAFAVQGTITGKTVKQHYFTTLLADPIDCTFEVDVQVKNNDATFVIKPSKKDVDWYFCTMPKAQFDGAKKEYGWDNKRVLMEYFQADVQGLAEEGMTPEQVLEALIHRGDLSLSGKGFLAESEFVYLIGALVRTGKELILVSEVSTGTYTTGKAPQSNLTFEYEVTNIRKTKVSIKVTPSNLTERFIWFCMPFNANTEGNTAEDLMNAQIAQWGPMMSMMATNGIQSHPDFSVRAGKTYYFYAFGYSGGPTTFPEMITFDTPPGAKPADVTIAVTPGVAQPYSAKISFQPSDETVYYAFGLLPDGTVDETEIRTEFETWLQETLKMMQGFDPNTTMEDVVTQYWYYGDFMDINFSKLEPNTKYTCFTLTINFDGTTAAFAMHPSFITTTALSNITATAEISGYFSGADEAGQLFGDADLTKDKAIIVLKYIPSAPEATGIYSFIQQEDPTFDALDPLVLSDYNIYQQLSGKWRTLNMKAPYMFLLAEWDANQVTFSHATDNKNAYGPISRKAIPAAKKNNIGTIDQLKALYDIANVPADKSVKTPMPIRFGATAAPAHSEMKIDYFVRKEAATPTSLLRPETPAVQKEQPAQSTTGKKSYSPGTPYYLPQARSVIR